MDNEVKFSVKILMDGQEKFVQATTNSKDLGAAIDKVSANSMKLNDQLLNTNQRVAAFQNLYDGARQLVGVTQELTDKYAQAEVANAKLVTIMRQRMGAQAEDVANVKNVISAQKELGVISGTVQVAGAQQMATFLNQKSSLETLIPAMNNLVAQQDGLNATQEDATSIGNMMGKAMQGQADVLQRVGVTFTEAQKQVLQYGTEEQRAATLAQVIKDNVGDMNHTLAQTDAGQAKKTSMWFDSLRVSVGAAMSSIQPFLATFNQIGMAAFTLIQIKNGFIGIAGATTLSTIATNAHTAATTVCTAVSSAHKAALQQLTIWTGNATVATAALAAAETMGLSIAITGVVTLIGKLCSGEDKATKSTQELTQAQQDAKQAQDSMNQTRADAKAGLDIMIAKLKSFHGTKEEEKKLISDCNQQYGDAMGYYGSVSDWYKVLTTNSAAYCQQMVIEAQTRILANKAAQAEQAAHDAIYNADGKKKKLGTKRKTVKGSTLSADGMGNVITETEIKGTSQLEQHERTYLAKKRESIAAQKQMNSLVQSQVKLQGKLHTQVGGTHQYKSRQAADDAGKKSGNKTDKKDNDDNVIRANAKSYADLGHNIEVYQKRLENTSPAEKGKIAYYSEQIEKLKAAQQGIKNMQEEYAKPAQLTTLQDYDNEIQRQEKRLKTAGNTERTSITATITELKKKREALEMSSKTEPVMAEIKSYDDLDDALTFYNDMLKTGDATARQSATAQIKALGELKAKWEEATAAANKPAGVNKLKTQKELDDAINYYQARMLNANSTEVTGLQMTIDSLQRKKKVMTELAGLSTGGAELGELGALSDKELKIKLKAIGLEEIEKKMRELKKLANSGAADPKQKKEIQGQLAAWQKYDKQLKKNQQSLGKTWGDIKSVGGGIKGLTSTLKGNGSAWEKLTGVVDSGIEIFNGVMGIIQMVKALTAATSAEQAGEATTQATANSEEASTWLGLAASKTAAAYASIPFAGVGLATAQTTALNAMVVAAAIPKFANGTLAYGPTLGMFGEYANAATNPEVVAPLDKLRTIINDGNGGGTGKVELKIKGRSLTGVLKKELRHSMRG